MFEQAWARTGIAAPHFDPKGDAAALGVLAGDFDAAERLGREMVASASGAATVGAHAKPAQLLVDVYLETGKDAAAAEVADAFLRHRAAWTPDPRGEDFAVARDPAPMMLAVRRRAGKLEQTEFLAQREAWVVAWRGALLPGFVRYAWVHGFAVPAAIVGTPEEARRALDVQPSFGEIPKFAPRTLVSADVGRTFLLADRADEALVWLKQATASCSAVEEPAAHTRAHLDLGLVLERAGDRDGACKAYGVVISRWGKAPKSITAARAREHAKKLSCPAP
jgi:hypothetical protein